MEPGQRNEWSASATPLSPGLAVRAEAPYPRLPAAGLLCRTHTPVTLEQRGGGGHQCTSEVTDWFWSPAACSLAGVCAGEGTWLWRWAAQPLRCLFRAGSAALARPDFCMGLRRSSFSGWLRCFSAFLQAKNLFSCLYRFTSVKVSWLF